MIPRYIFLNEMQVCEFSMEATPDEKQIDIPKYDVTIPGYFKEAEIGQHPVIVSNDSDNENLVNELQSMTVTGVYNQSDLKRHDWDEFPGRTRFLTMDDNLYLIDSEAYLPLLTEETDKGTRQMIFTAIYSLECGKPGLFLVGNLKRSKNELFRTSTIMGIRKNV